MKTANKVASAMAFLVDLTWNQRDASGNLTGYDLGTMIEAILSVGRILEPVHIWKRVLSSGETVLQVLRGHRRILAAQKIMNDPQAPQSVVEALKKVPYIEYTDLTEQEAFEITADHGQQKPLWRYELILAIWRAYQNMFREKEITRAFFYQLAEFTGSTAKLAGVPKENGPERDEYLASWLHGTVGNFILRVATMGQEIKEQFILTQKNDDGLLKTEEEKAAWKVKVDRKLVKQLSEAKTKDGKEWTVDKGGPAFNKAWEAAKELGTKRRSSSDEGKMTPKELKDRADSSQSQAVRQLLTVASGNKVENLDLAKMDSELYRRDLIFEVLSNKYDGLNGSPLKPLIQKLLYGSPAEVETILVESSKS